MNDADVGRRIQAARVSAGMERREELAQKAALPKLGPATLGKIERGERPLYRHEAPALAEALNVSVDYLYGHDSDLAGAHDARLGRIEEKLDRVLALLDGLETPAAGAFVRTAAGVARRAPAHAGTATRAQTHRGQGREAS